MNLHLNQRKLLAEDFALRLQAIEKPGTREKISDSSIVYLANAEYFHEKPLFDAAGVFKTADHGDFLGFYFQEDNLTYFGTLNDRYSFSFRAESPLPRTARNGGKELLTEAFEAINKHYSVIGKSDRMKTLEDDLKQYESCLVNASTYLT